MNEQQESLSKNIVSSGQLVQKFEIDNDPNIKLNYSNINNITVTTPSEHFSFNGRDDMGNGIQITTNNNKPGTIILTYSNISGIKYQNRKITKVVEKITLTPNNNVPGMAAVASNLYYGFAITNAILTIDRQFYYDTGELVKFVPNTAYLSVASLNNYSNSLNGYGVETVDIVSGGKAMGLWGSSVTPHGQSLYSNGANSVNDDGIEVAIWDGKDSTEGDKHHYPGFMNYIGIKIPSFWEHEVVFRISLFNNLEKLPQYTKYLTYRTSLFYQGYEIF